MNLYREKKINSYVITLLFIIIVPTTSQFLFSWIGFNPTDDGFFLAMSRRIAEGQIPHRDFIELRPLVTSFIHLPFVLIGGDHTFWISRYFVWFEFACIAWCWVLVLERLTLSRFNNTEKILTGLIIFSFSVHNFPPMVWGTIDGIFLSSLGLFISLKEKPAIKFTGYLLIGLACLCKQGFLLMIPAVLLALGDWKKIYYWTAAALPGIIYVIYLIVNGAFVDAYFQLTYRSDILLSTSSSFLFNWILPWGILTGFFVFKFINNSFKIECFHDKDTELKLVGMLIILAILFFAAYMLGTGRFHYEIPLFLLGIVVGFLGFNITDANKKKRGEIQLTFLIITVSVCTSFSQGYSTPALAGGSIVAVIIYYLFYELKSFNIRTIYYSLYILLTAAVLVGLYEARENYVYRDLPAKYLTEDIGDVFPGGKCIKTNKNTKRFLADLQKAIQKTNGAEFTIVPQIPGYWVHSKQLNPLNADLTDVNVGRSYLMKFYYWVVSAVEAQRGKIYFIVQKLDATNIKDDLATLDSDKYLIVQYIKDHFKKIYNTEFFEIYR